LGELEESLNILSWDLPGDIKIERIKKLEELLDPHGQELKTFYIYDEYSEELTLIRKEKRSLEKRIKEERRKLKDKIKEELKVSIRPDDSILISKNEVELLDKLKASPYLAYSSETYMNIKYSIIATALIDELEKEMESLKAREDREEFKIRTCLSLEIASESKEIFRNMEAIGKLDLTIGKAYMAINIKGVKPKISENHIVDIVEGRHLKVEDTLRKRNQQFTPISVSLREGVTCITGANMGGKTVSLKLTGLLCAMTQYGIFPPCKEMEIGLHKFIYLSMGDWQSTDQGLSTFGGEIRGIQEAISSKRKRGLILIDELARGTNPEEGYAISKAIVNYMKTRDSITVITTHYDNIADDEDVTHLQVIGLANTDYEKLRRELGQGHTYGIDIINPYMDYRLARVTNRKEVPRDAINIARLMGLDEDILIDAERILQGE